MQTSKRITIAKSLAPLASLAAQRRYIIHGTRSEYYIPTELLNRVAEVIRQVGTVPNIQSCFSASESKAILVLDNLLNDACRAAESDGSNEYLVESDPAWRLLREQVAHCLETIAFNLSQWEKQEIFSLPSI